jgi:hypothetical protein
VQTGTEVNATNLAVARRVCYKLWN